MKILILGDTHGQWGDLNIVIARALRKHPDITAFVQVGDMGYAWPGGQPFKFLKTYMDDALLEKAESTPFYWLDGNHENHDQLDADGGAYQPNMIYQARGSIRELDEGKRAMFFGGASSIDKSMRIEGKSWWPQESIKYGQVLSALQQPGPIDIMFSHEYPSAFQYRSYEDNFGKGDQDALEALRLNFRPKFWIFGHHHHFEQGECEGTKWMCAPIIDAQVPILWDGTRLQALTFRKKSRFFDNTL